MKCLVVVLGAQIFYIALVAMRFQLSASSLSSSVRISVKKEAGEDERRVLGGASGSPQNALVEQHVPAKTETA